MKLRPCTLAAITVMAVMAAVAACGDKSNTDAGDATTGPGTTGAATDGATTTSGGESTASTSSTPTSTATTAPTSSTGPGPTGGEDTLTSEGGSFLPGNPDAGGGLECDVLAEDCPAGQKCMPYVRDGGGNQWNGLKCVPVDPAPVGVGEACTAPGNGLTGIDNCDKHVMCFDVDDDMGVCAAMCVDNDCAEGFNCFVANDGILNLCLQACNVNMPDCPRGTGCLPVLGGGVCAPA